MGHRTERTVPTDPTRRLPGQLFLEFCGETVEIDRSGFGIGRHTDYVVDSANRHLHRRFVSIDARDHWWEAANVGDRLTATFRDGDGLIEAFVSPGGRFALTTAVTTVHFSAGPTAYEIVLRLTDAPVPAPPGVRGTDDGTVTAGRTRLTDDQHRLVVALAEPALRHGRRAAVEMPSTADAAHRLGWSVTRFNRKLDHVCQKLARDGVRGLHGAPGRLAATRRARLVEHALAARLVTADDLDLLDIP